MPDADGQPTRVTGVDIYEGTPKLSPRADAYYGTSYYLPKTIQPSDPHTGRKSDGSGRVTCAYPGGGPNPTKGVDLHNAKLTIVLGGVGPTAKGARSLTPTRQVLELPVLSDEDMELEDGADVERGFDEANLSRLLRKISKAVVTKALQVAHDTGDEYKDLTKRGLDRWLLNADVQAKISFVSPDNPRKTQCTSWPLIPLTEDTLCATPSQLDPA